MTTEQKIKSIIESSEQSNDQVSCLDNGSGFAYKYDKYSDGTFVECVSSVDWSQDVEGDISGKYMLTKGVVYFKNSNSDNDDCENLGDLVFSAMAYSGVEGNEYFVYTQDYINEVDDPDMTDGYDIIDSDTNIDQHIIDNYCD